MLELQNPIPLNTPKGPGFAYFVSDPGFDHDLMWTVFLQNGEIWCFQNREVRAVENYTFGRRALKEKCSQINHNEVKKD